MLDGMIDDGIAIIPTVRYESFCLKIFYKLQSLLTVSLCTCCNKSSEGIPCASTARCTLVLSPLLCDP